MTITGQTWYDAARTTLFVGSLIAFPLCFFIDAPFGRFAPSKGSIFMVDGINAWICMELVSPLVFLYSFLTGPLSSGTPPPSWTHPSALLAALFVTHYINRALVSPLRTPSRSRSHILINVGGAWFNLANGSTMGAYLASPSARAFLADAYSRPLFIFGIALWAAGFVGNVVHDEVLLDIRRKASAKKGKATGAGEYYGIPQGLLYEWISYPNYLCEWVEWFGFAIAAAPLPSLAMTMLSSLVFFVRSRPPMSLSSLTSVRVPETLTPPWIFAVSEVLVMLPRAYRGHQWYLKRFPEYPKKRKAVLPFVL